MRLFCTFLLSINLFWLASCEPVSQTLSQAEESDQTAETAQTESVAPGINNNFKNTPEDVEQWAERFSGESREVYSARYEVTKALGIQPGDSVADIGAGTGIYTQLFANAVGESGRIFAVDIFEEFLGFIAKNAAADGIENITTVLGEERTTNLPSGSLDIVFHSDTYHHFEYPADMNQDIYNAMKPDGRLFVLDFERIPGVTPQRMLDHVRASKEKVIAEIQSSGFELVEQIDLPELSDNYLLEFRKRS